MLAHLIKSQQENNTQWQVFILITKIQSRQPKVDLGGQAFMRGGQSLKLSTKTAVFKRVSFLVGGPSMSIGGPDPPGLLGSGSDKILVFVQDGLGGACPPWLRLCKDIRNIVKKIGETGRKRWSRKLVDNFSNFKPIEVSNFNYTRFTKVWHNRRSVTLINYYSYSFVLRRCIFSK